MSRQKIKSVIEKRTFEIVLTVVLIGLIAATTQASEVSNILDAGSSSNLVAEYRFDTGAGDTVFDTAGNNDGTINGASWTKGVEGKALSFDGSDDYVEGGTDNKFNLQKNGALTVSVWVKGDFDSSGQTFQHFVSKGDNGGGTAASWGLTVVNDKDVSINIQDGSNAYRSGNGGASKISDGKWHHIVSVARPDGTLDNYIDGSRIGGSTWSGDPSNSGSFSVGRSGGGDYTNGKIDNIRIYSDALNNSQISSLYRGGSWKVGTYNEENKPSKVLDMSFQHQNSTHAFDTSGYKNHGSTRNGASQEGAVNCKVGRCYSFEGQDDYVELNQDIASVDSSHTAGMWINTEDNSSEQFFFSFRPIMVVQANLNWGTQGELSLYDTNSYQFIGNNPDNDEWMHVSWSYNESTNQWISYINGKRTNSWTQDLSSGGGSDNPVIGDYSTSGGLNFNGKIDQVNVWNRSLSQEEIIANTEGISSDGAVLDMRFEAEGGDLVEDYSVEENHGRINPNETAGPERTDGIKGNALNFDGNDDYVDMGDQEEFNFASDEEFSYSIWFRPEDYTEINNGYVWIQHERSYFIQRDSNNMELSSNIGGLGTSFNVKPEAGRWHHATLTYDSGTLTLYYNGEQANQVSTSAENMTGVDLTINTPRFSGDWYANGAVDSLRVYPYALSDSKVQDLYSRGRSRIGSTDNTNGEDLEEDLVLDQTIDRIETCGQSDTISCPSGMSGEVAVDESGEANHGELVNGPTEKDTKDCKASGCLSFDGNSHYLATSDADSISIGKKDLTIAGWVNYDEIKSSHQTVISKRQDYLGSGHSGYDFILTKDEGKIRIVLDDGSNIDVYDSNSQVPTNKWGFIAASIDRNGNATFYLNGQKDRSVDVSGTSGSLENNRKMRIGGQEDDSGTITDYFEGELDELKIYNRSLSYQEIWKLYTQGRDRENGKSGSIAHWNFNKPVGTEHYPAKSCNQIYDVRDNSSSGTYWIDPDQDGENKQQVYCDMGLKDDGWTLIYNYNHTGGTNPDVTEGKWPLSQDALSHQDNLQRFGFDQQRIREVRFRCETSNHNRIVHYVSKDSDTIQGVLDNSTSIGWQSVSNSSYNLSEHTGYLPGAAGSDTGENEGGNALFGPGFPMYNGGNYHWTIGEPNRGGNRWECDDYPGDESQDTLHQIWVKSGGAENITDVSGEGNEGEIKGDPQLVSGKQGKAMKFDGNDDYVEISHQGQLSGMEDLTMTFWSNWDGTGEGVAVGGQSLYEIVADSGDHCSSGTMWWAVGNGQDWTVNCAGVEFPTSWTHWALVSDTSEDKVLIYRNGELVVEDAGTGPIADNTNDLGIGKRGDDSFPFSGEIDDVRIYPYALNQDQVKQVKNSGATTVG